MRQRRTWVSRIPEPVGPTAAGSTPKTRTQPFFPSLRPVRVAALMELSLRRTHGSRQLFVILSVYQRRQESVHRYRDGHKSHFRKISYPRGAKNRSLTTIHKEERRPAHAGAPLFVQGVE